MFLYSIVDINYTTQTDNIYHVVFVYKNKVTLQLPKQCRIEDGLNRTEVSKDFS